jgi:hypothetical protein
MKTPSFGTPVFLLKQLFLLEQFFVLEQFWSA